MSAWPVLPSAAVVVPLLAAFALAMVKYYILNPTRRVTEPHFLLALGAVAAILLYLFLSVRDPGNGALSCGFAAAGLVWITLAAALFRRKSKPLPPGGFGVAGG